MQNNNCERLLKEIKQVFSDLNLESYYFPFRQFVGTIPSITEDEQKMVFEWIDKTVDKEPPCNGASGKLHVFGGGFVADTASVAYTAYIGPTASVCDGASVQDIATIENSSIFGDSIVSGNSKITDSTVSESFVHGKAEFSHSQLENAEVSSFIPKGYTWTGLVNEQEAWERLIYDECEPLKKAGYGNYSPRGRMCFDLHVRKIDQELMEDLKHSFGEQFNERERVITVDEGDTLFMKTSYLKNDCFLLNCVNNTAAIEIGNSLVLNWSRCEGSDSDSECGQLVESWRQTLAAGHQLEFYFSVPTYFVSSSVLVNRDVYYLINSWRVIRRNEGNRKISRSDSKKLVTYKKKLSSNFGSSRKSVDYMH